MPIYVYACASCGLQQDVLQKMSDSPLTICPECGTQTFSRQLTAAGFQLKGNGYYVTDFKNGSQKPEVKTEKSGVKTEAKTEQSSTPATPASSASPSSTPSATTSSV